MRISPHAVVLLSILSVALTAGCLAAETPQAEPVSASSSISEMTSNDTTVSDPPEGDAPDNDRPLSDDAETQEAPSNPSGLKMSIRVSHPDSTESLRVHVRIQNQSESENDYVLNLGIMRAKGRIQIPNAICLILTDSVGNARELHFSDRDFPGRVEDYAVPLRSGSAYEIELQMRDLWCPLLNEMNLDLKPDTYTVRALLTPKTKPKADPGQVVEQTFEFLNEAIESNLVRFVMPKEPTHEGRTVSSWLQDLAYGRFPDMDKHRTAERALRAIGVDAIPVLTKRLSAEADTLDSIQDIHTLSAFRALGADASPAIPDLIKLLAQAYEGAAGSRLKDRKSNFVAFSLGAIGDASAIPLVRALESDDVRIRFGAATALQHFRRSADDVVPALIKALHDIDQNVRWRSVRSLGELNAKLEQSVPAIAERLHNDPATAVRMYAVTALRNIGKISIPDLRKASTDNTDPFVKDDAAKALQELEAQREVEQ